MLPLFRRPVISCLPRRGADLVTRVRQGREVACALTDDHVSHIVRDAMAHTLEPH